MERTFSQCIIVYVHDKCNIWIIVDNETSQSNNLVWGVYENSLSLKILSFYLKNLRK